ncbi:hypothetical protein [uncultured Jatrophihabitans sp.]|uniref:hypothetical protein n=1 Tax=uncultured Jatrophihabitans sp. TaxID=1610747 RepID=UPI0035C96B4B
MGGWDVEAGAELFKRCRFELPVIEIEDASNELAVVVDRWADLEQPNGGEQQYQRHVQHATVELNGMHLKPDEAKLLAAWLKEAAQLAVS